MIAFDPGQGKSALTGDHHTLSDGWEALWCDLQYRSTDRAALRQAFKNGAAGVGALLQTRGRAFLQGVLAEGHEHVLQAFWPWIARNLEAHPDWGEAHRDAVIAGIFTGLLRVRNNAPLLKEIERFIP